MLDPDAGAEFRRTDEGQHRQQQQDDAGEHRDVAVALQHAVVADDHDHDEGDGHGQRGPHDLAHRGGLPAGGVVGDVDAVDLGDAQAVEQGDDRQDERVRLRGDEAQGDVHAQGQHGETGALEDHVEAHACRARRAARARSRRR